MQLNIMNGLKIWSLGWNCRACCTQNDFLRRLLMPLWIYSSDLTLFIMSNQRHKIFALNLFVGSCAPSSKLYQSGINKGNHLSVFIINHPKSQERINLEIFLMIEPLAKLGRTISLIRIGIQINPICQFLTNMELLFVHFFYHLKKLAEIVLR